MYPILRMATYTAELFNIPSSTIPREELRVESRIMISPMASVAFNIEKIAQQLVEPAKHYEIDAGMDYLSEQIYQAGNCD